jgi:septal ring factor EnvC (AmiA/AmiB activator)
MKNRIGVVLLVLVCLGLGVALFMMRKEATDRQAHDAERIGYYSNEWVSTSQKLDDQTQVAAENEKQLTAKKRAFEDLTNGYTRLSTDLTEASATLTQTEASLKASQEEVAKRDAKIADLEAQNQSLDSRAHELSQAITNLTQQITDTKKRLAASEGDKAYLESQLKQLLAEKAQLEHQFKDLDVLRAQVRKVKQEIATARRIEWARKGFYGTQPKGAQLLMQGRMAVRPPQPPPATNYDLNVEINSRGGARILPPATNQPAKSNSPAK